MNPLQRWSKYPLFWVCVYVLCCAGILGIALLSSSITHAQQAGLVGRSGMRTDGAYNLFIRQNNTPGTADPCQNPDVLKSSAKITLTSTTVQELVAAVAGKTVYVCGFSATIQGSITTVGTLQFETGTKVSTACDTNPVTLTDVYQGNINANVPTLVTSPGGGFTNFSSAVASEICAVATGTTISDKGYIVFVQQ